MAAPDSFPPRGKPRFASRSKQSGFAILADASAFASLRVQIRSPAAFVAMKAAIGAADPTKESPMTTDHEDAATSRAYFISTDHVLAELSSTATVPSRRTRPETAARSSDCCRRRLRHFRRPHCGLGDTRLEPDLEDLLWSTVNLFHRAVGRIERELDDNEQAQRRSQKEQDGSEIRSVELERSRRRVRRSSNAATAWNSSATKPPSTSSATSAHPGGRARARWSIIARSRHDDRQPRFSRRQRRAETKLLLPPAPRSLYRRSRLQRSSRDMGQARQGPRQTSRHVLLHGGSPKGAELIAAKWATNRKAPQIAFKPDWAKHAKAAPSSAMTPCSTFCRSASSSSGQGIQDNLATGRKLGIQFGSSATAAHERRSPPQIAPEMGASRARSTAEYDIRLNTDLVERQTLEPD